MYWHRLLTGAFRLLSGIDIESEKDLADVGGLQRHSLRNFDSRMLNAGGVGWSYDPLRAGQTSQRTQVRQERAQQSQLGTYSNDQVS